MELNDAIENRRSIRSFKSTRPDWRNIIEAIDAARFAPMAGNIFSLKFVLVDDPEKIYRISKWAEQQFISEAQYVVVFVSTPGKTIRKYGKDAESYCKQQAGAAIQNFWLKLGEYNLSTCWVGYFNEKQIKKVLKIPEDEKIEGIFPIGYAAEKPKAQNLRDLNTYLYFDEWKNKRMKPIEKIDARTPEGYGRKIE